MKRGARAPRFFVLERRSRRVGKGALATCPPSITDHALKWWARFALPTLRTAALICLARKRNLNAQLRQISMAGKSLLEICQARGSKIFCFRSHANQSHNSARLTADEGRWPSSRTRGEMRWTRELRLTCAARAYGEVVWFGRRGAGVKFAGSKLPADDGGKRAVLRGEHEVSRKAIAQGRPECFRRTCMLVCSFCYVHMARETAGAACTRSSLRPLISKRAGSLMQTSGDQRRENAKPFFVGWVERSDTHRHTHRR